MSVIANYVRVSDDQLRAWRSNPELLNEIAAGRVPGAEHCDVDKAYQAIAWLLSPVKREEQRQAAAEWSDIRGLDSDTNADSKVDFANESSVDYSNLEPDLLLTAIEGRAADEERDTQIQYGLGAACVFTPGVVQEMHLALKAITAQSFGLHFAPDVMTEQMVEPEIWDEGDVLLEEYLRPAFECLRSFFERAAVAKQNLVVVYT